MHRLSDICVPAVLQLDAPLTVDMRSFPPCVAEAYINVVMAAIEGRGKAVGSGDVNRQRAVAQPVRLIVPPFDHNYVMWPSYVQKLFVHYNEQLLARQVSLELVGICQLGICQQLATKSRERWSW